MPSVAEVVELSGYKKSQVYRDINSGLLTKVGSKVLEDEKLAAYIQKKDIVRVEKKKREIIKENSTQSPAKYNAPPENKKTSMSMDWLKDVKNVSEYDFERDLDYDNVEKRTVNGIDSILDAYQNIGLEHIMADDVLQKNYREWLKLAQSMVKAKRDVDAKKEVASKTSDNQAAFTHVLNVAQGKE